MKINNINFLQYKFNFKNKNENNQNAVLFKNSKTKNLNNDTFIKSSNAKMQTNPLNNLSFKGDEDWRESMGRRARHIVADPDKINHYLVSLANLSFDEMTTQMIMDIITNPRYIQSMRTLKTLKIDGFLARTIQNSQNFASLCKENGITTVAQLNGFVNIFNNSETRKTFDKQNIEAVKIYSLLNRKDDLKKYGELLLYLYNEESQKTTPDYERLNKATNFLKQLKLESFKDFDKKFAHLKSGFNNFEDISDKLDAIEYIKKTYDDKISKLDTILKVHKLPKAKDASTLYALINDVVDTIYIKNKKNLKPLEEILETALNAGKIKPKSLDCVKDYFNNFELCEDKINFYKFLTDSNVSVDDFIVLSGKNYIQGDDIPFKKIQNAKYLTSLIEQLSNKTPQEAKETYKNFADILNAFCDSEDVEIEKIEGILNLIEKFEIKNSQCLVTFYNKSSLENKNIINPQDLEELTDLFKYTNDTNIFKSAEKQKTSAIELLKVRKEEFEKIEEEIKDFLLEDKSVLFALQSPIDVFNNYYQIIKDSKDIKNNLQALLDFDITTVQEYSNKAQKIEKFEEFFENKQDLLKFFSINQINFDKEDETYLENCFKILNAIYDKNDDSSKDKIAYLAKSGFLIKSKALLTPFLEQTKENNTTAEILSLITDKKIPSLISLEKFLLDHTPNETETNNRADKLKSYKKLIEYLSSKNSGNDFASCTKALDKIQAKLDNLNIQTKITSSNISQIDCTRYENKETITNPQIIQILELLNLNSKGNFLTSLENNSTTACNDNMTCKNTKINVYRIAREIAKNAEKSAESYQNIISLLNLDKKSLNLAPDCSEYIYASAIAEKLDEDFINFINSPEWSSYADMPLSISLHARLRVIDRFALSDVKDIKELYSKETKEKLKDLFKAIYTQNPCFIKGSRSDMKIIVDFQYGKDVIETLFTTKGDMVTLVKKDPNFKNLVNKPFENYFNVG